jgi:hypothetical protein
MGDRRKCQTFTASTTEPGGLPVMLERDAFRFAPVRTPGRTESPVISGKKVGYVRRSEVRPYPEFLK